jgi:hypothetical protein
MKSPLPIVCRHCRNDDPSMIELLMHEHIADSNLQVYMYLCSVCSKTFIVEVRNDSKD